MSARFTFSIRCQVQGRLHIRVDHEDTKPQIGEQGAEVGGERRLAGATLGTDYCEPDHVTSPSG